MPRLRAVPALLALVAACGGGDGGVALPSDAIPLADRNDQPPVALNAVSPVAYPANLAREGIEGTVILRLFVDSAGRMLPDSTLVAESSGYPDFDSAAVAGAGQLRFAPALRRGTPVAAAFMQPIHFRNPGRAPSP